MLKTRLGLFSGINSFGFGYSPVTGHATKGRQYLKIDTALLNKFRIDPRKNAIAHPE